MDDVDLEEVSKRRVEPDEEEIIEDFEVDPVEANTGKEGLFQQDFIFPTLNPIGRAFGEIGLYKLSGAGTAKIQFEQVFAGTPLLISSTFGLWEIQLPFGFNWQEYSLFGRTISLPDSINWETIRVPNPCFQLSVDEEGCEFINGFGDSYVSYLALEV